MRVRILGSGAGGGFPQWNCNCANCRAVRAGKPGFSPRTQSSLAVSADGRNWLLLNASPDLRRQVEGSPSLQPESDAPPRSSPIKAVAITNGDVDHITGLLNLREAQPFTLYGAKRTLDVIAANGIFDVLNPLHVERREMPFDLPFPVVCAGVELGLTLRAFPVPGKIPLYLERENVADFSSSEGDVLGLEVTAPATGTSIFYLPGCARLDAPLKARLKGVNTVFFDGTLWSEDEMLAQGLMSKTGSRMGHMNMSGPHGSIAAFADLEIPRKVFVHINNSNPVLDAFSPQRAEANAAGWVIGEDGMEFPI